jgi:hypothetical protein
MDEKVVDMLNDRFDRLETKMDDLIQHKWLWVGRMSVITFLGSIVVSFFISRIWK